MLRLTIPIVIITLFFTSCFQLLDSGQSTLIKESYNKQESKKAVLFSNSGNATLDYSLQVSITDYDYELNKEAVGNTFTVDADHSKAKLDSTSINFQWLSNDTLLIDYDAKLRTFLQERKVEGVTILYKPR